MQIMHQHPLLPSIFNVLITRSLRVSEGAIRVGLPEISEEPRNLGGAKQILLLRGFQRRVRKRDIDGYGRVIR